MQLMQSVIAVKIKNSLMIHFWLYTLYFFLDFDNF